MDTYKKELIEDSEDYIEAYMKEFSITKQMLSDSIDHLKAWYKMQPHFPEIELDDDYYIRTLGNVKFSIERSKENIENLFTARTIYPECFLNVDSDDINEALQIFELLILPKFTKNKERITLIRYHDSDPNQYSPYKTLKYLLYVAETCYKFENGFDNVYIVDYKNIKFSQSIKANPMFYKKSLFILMQGYKFRVKAYHVLNMPTFAQNMYKIVQPILGDKQNSRIYFHNSLDELHQHVDKDLLPIEYGGKTHTCDELNGFLRNIMESDEVKDLQRKSLKHKSDESKRINSSKEKMEEKFGLAGSFRELSID